jgi:ElaB/YqjD/DUF883 family membrane-anchored ribosome-binding protein
MDREPPELIKRDMCDTRQSLTDKVSELERQVMGTVHHAANAVQDTVNNVKSAVQNTMSGVKATFDVASHVRENPWTAIGIAAATGAIAGYLTAPHHRSHGAFKESASLGGTYAATHATAERPLTPTLPSPFVGIFDEIVGAIRRELIHVGEAALTTIAASLQEAIANGVRNLVDSKMSSNNLRDEIDDESRVRSERHNGHAGARA